MQATIDRFGRVDGLVNNAGAGTFSRIDGTTPEAFLDLLNLNVVSVVTSIQAVLPYMRAAGHGRIVYISSGRHRVADGGQRHHPATKTTVNWLSQVGRLELSGDNIQVTLLLPSVADTEFYPAGGLPTGLVAHSPEYVGRVILRALRTGEERIDIPHGPEQPEFPGVG